jgi:hypothetical protein
MKMEKTEEKATATKCWKADGQLLNDRNPKKIEF